MPQNSVQSFAALRAGADVEPWTYEAGPLGDHDVDLEVTHCGVCHTDLHLINNDLGVSSYPLVPGHEAVGTITALGDSVKNLRLGQRVGVGWQRGSCGRCEWCVGEQENLCAQSRPTCLAGFGGYARSLRTDAHFAIPIPDGLASASAAPMLCAGITVYSPLRRFAREGSRVGIVGIGGLGHLALQFARAMGAEVFAFSSSAEKREEAVRFGAHHFVDFNETNGGRGLTGSLDLILSTATAELNWATWLTALRPNGTFCLVGASPGPVKLPVLPMIFGQYSFTASVIGSPARIAEMFQFATDHKIDTAVETLPMHQANEALRKVAQNKARYRMVLTW